MIRNRRIVVSMGDPAGIGPEIIIKAATAGYLDDIIVVGDSAVLACQSRYLDSHFEPVLIKTPAEALAPGRLYVINNGVDHSNLTLGVPSVCAGLSSLASLNKAVDYVLEGSASALVTAPINKQAIKLAGSDHIGHTEILAERAGNVPVSMALVNEALKVLLVTCHQPLRSVFASLTADRLLQAFRHADELLKRYGYQDPHIAVAGLNPHAGEGGVLGDEEHQVIIPAINKAVAMGLPVTGPYPPDTVFMRARSGDFDLVVALYHDQGLIPIKYLGLDHGVNISVGLPFVRTSPDHGTAYDIVNQDRASPLSLIASLEQAKRLK